jgi:hypothetical protein
MMLRMLWDMEHILPELWLDQGKELQKGLLAS